MARKETPEYKIHQICMLLESKKYTQENIAKYCSVSVTVVSNIYRRKRHTNISNQYEWDYETKNPRQNLSKDTVIKNDDHMKRAKHKITTNSPENSKWKQIVIDGDPFNYEVNKNGIVRNISSNLSIKEYHRKNKNVKEKDGCSWFSLSKTSGTERKQFTIFKKRLLACMFVPIPEKYKNIDQLELETYFINGDQSDYSIENIGWYYPLDMEASKEDIPHWRSVTNLQIKQAVDLFNSGKFSIGDISKQTNIHRSTLDNLKKYGPGIKTHKIMTKDIHITRLPRSHLPERKIIEVCELLSTNNYSLRKISEICKVNYRVVSDIYRRKTYTSISKNYTWRCCCRKVSKLDKNTVIEICELLQDKKLFQHEIAKKCGCSLGSVNNIYLRKAHTDISKDYKW